MKWDKELSDELKLVDEEIEKLILSEQKTLMNTALYVIKSGGKRIRPAVGLLSYKMAGGTDIQKIVPLTAGYELVHSATLIHDDINDKSDLRRGKKAVNKVFGSSSALITGDFLFVKGFQAAGVYGAEVVRITADACSKLAEGEIQQQKHTRNGAITEDEYISIITNKTAMPIAAIAKVGAVLGGGNDVQIEALWDYGLNLGILFQIIDDVLDVSGNEKTTGKPVGHDLVQGQVTLPYIAAMKKARKADRTTLETIVEKEIKTEEDIVTALELVEKYKGVDYTFDAAKAYGEKARNALSIFDDGKYKTQLDKLVDDTLNRRK